MADKKIISLVSNLDKDEKLEYRTPPYNTEAEQILLGSILSNNEHITKVGDFLIAEHFYEGIHRRIYETIIKFMDRGMVASPVTLKTVFDKDEGLKEIGGATYLAKLAANATGIINILDYGRVIYDLAIRRKLIEIGEDMVNNAYDNEVDSTAQDQIEKSENHLFTLASEGNVEKSFQHLSTSLDEVIKKAELAMKDKDSITGVSTGFKDLDKILGGFHRSDLVILAARPSMGKTALAINMAIKTAEIFKKDFEKENKKLQASGSANPNKKPKCVGFFSLEMSSEQIASRILAIESEVNAYNIRQGRFNNQADHQNLIAAHQKIHDLPIHVDDTAAISISALRTRARRLKRKNNLALLVVDYLQLIRGVSESGKNNRVQEVSEITQGLKAIAKELDIPVIALSQLSRQVEQREDKKPQLADLRESGTIEQDSDIVMFIYREAYYKEREKPSERNIEEFTKWQEKMNEINNISEIMIAKHRNGPIGNVELYFDKNTTSFKDLDKHHPESPF